MTDVGGFALLGAPDDETRLLVHRASGYSTPIPGHPTLVAQDPRTAPPRYDAIVRLADLKLEHGVRIDELPAGTDPEELAQALARAYASDRAATPPNIRPVVPAGRPEGTRGAATAMYMLRDVSGTIEQLVVLVHPRDGGLWALYHTIRHALREVTPVQWAHVRSATVDKQHWDPAAPRTVAPPLWPAHSAYAKPSATLELTPEAWSEAQAKAADVGPLDDRDTEQLVHVLLETANTDDTPTFQVPPVLIQLLTRRIAMIGPSRATDVLLRNLSGVVTAHDLRAWCWQGIWAIGNRDDRDASQRTTN